MTQNIETVGELVGTIESQEKKVFDPGVGISTDRESAPGRLHDLMVVRGKALLQLSAA